VRRSWAESGGVFYLLHYFTITLSITLKSVSCHALSAILRCQECTGIIGDEARDCHGFRESRSLFRKEAVLTIM